MRWAGGAQACKFARSSGVGLASAREAENGVWFHGKFDDHEVCEQLLISSLCGRGVAEFALRAAPWGGRSASR